jgi:hypothetical protein
MLKNQVGYAEYNRRTEESVTRLNRRKAALMRCRLTTQGRWVWKTRTADGEG